MNMNTAPVMNWQEFKTRLQEHPQSILQFQYAVDKRVDASYHITEIKQAPVVSVDCGGIMNAWTEIIVQLWEPPQKGSEKAMAASKALKIIDIVESKLPLNPLGLVKIEFGNAQFDTRQMYPAGFIHDGENLIVSLTPDYTQCKAFNRGGSCGTADPADGCCTPATEVTKKKVELANLAADTACCTPESGCC